LGKTGVHEIKGHHFFKGLDWNKIREQTAPIIPTLKDQYDIGYFLDQIQEHENSNGSTSEGDSKDEDQDEDYAFGKARNHWPAFTFMSPALRRLTLGTWGRNTFVSNMGNPIPIQNFFKNVSDNNVNNSENHT
jgi:hypothetical protein